MLREKRVVNGNLTQITTENERWYESKGVYYPSATWICSMYPKGLQFWKWLASTGWNESKEIKEEAGKRGSNVHHAIENINAGATLSIEEYTVEEWVAIESYVNWYKAQTEINVLHSEITLINEEFVFAGTVDMVAEIDGELWVIDFKTAKSIWKEYHLQLACYTECIKKMYPGREVKMGVLQVGYNMNKKKYKLTEIKDFENNFELFLAARKIWESEHGSEEPKEMDLPNELFI